MVVHAVIPALGDKQEDVVQGQTRLPKVQDQLGLNSKIPICRKYLFLTACHLFSLSLLLTFALIGGKHCVAVFPRAVGRLGHSTGLKCVF